MPACSVRYRHYVSYKGGTKYKMWLAHNVVAAAEDGQPERRAPKVIFWEDHEPAGIIYRVGRPPIGEVAPDAHIYYPYVAEKSSLQNSEVMIFESEPVAERAAKQMPATIACVSWVGGREEALKMIKWHELNGKIITIVHNHDPNARGLTKRLFKGLQISIKAHTLRETIWPNPKDLLYEESLPKKLADNINTETSIEGVDAAPEPVPETYEDALLKKMKDQNFFRVLGRSDAAEIYIRRQASMEIRAFNDMKLTSSVFNWMAKRSYWRKLFADIREAPRKGQTEESSPCFTPVIREYIEDAIRAWALSRPKITMDSMRKLGSTIDGDRIVYHLGNKLLVDGKIHELTDADEFEYYYGEETTLPWAPPPENWRKLAKEMVYAIRKFRWASDRDWMIFVGWLGVALAAGAMPWRPNVWIHAATNNGKSWLIDEIVEALFGLHCRVIGDITPAALAWTCQNTGQPIIMDETNNAALVSIIDSLKRTSSSARSRIRVLGIDSKGAKIGSSSERTPFLFANASMPIMTEEIRNRIIEIRISDKRLSDEEWKEVSGNIKDSLTPGKAAAIRNGIVSVVHDMTDEVKALLGDDKKFGKFSRELSQHAALAIGFKNLCPDFTIAEILEGIKNDPIKIDGKSDAVEALIEALMMPIKGDEESEFSTKVGKEKTLLEWMSLESGHQIAAKFGFKYIRHPKAHNSEYSYAIAIARSGAMMKKLAKLMNTRQQSLVKIFENLPRCVKPRNKKFFFSGPQLPVIIFLPEEYGKDFVLTSEGKINPHERIERLDD